MSLTKGAAPFGETRRGRFNFDMAPDAPVLYWEPSERWLRVRFAGETVVDSRRARRLHETGRLPVYYFPREDVRQDLLEPSAQRTRCPHKGVASYWSLRTPRRTATDAVWAYEEPLDSAAFLQGHFAFEFEAMDEWMEEEEHVRVHPRDPYHRVEVLRSSRAARVRVDGAEVARSARPKLLFETGLPVRVYLPPDDVRVACLHPSDTRTGCPYKGIASYRSVEIDGRIREDVAWCYEQPLPEAQAVAGHLCFSQEADGVEVALDGAPLD